jgi:hypothetical protein
MRRGGQSWYTIARPLPVTAQDSGGGQAIRTVTRAREGAAYSKGLLPHGGKPLVSSSISDAMTTGAWIQS